MNQLNHRMVKEFYKHNKEVQNKKTYELNINKKKLLSTTGGLSNITY